MNDASRVKMMPGQAADEGADIVQCTAADILVVGDGLAAVTAALVARDSGAAEPFLRHPDPTACRFARRVFEEAKMPKTRVSHWRQP